VDGDSTDGIEPEGVEGPDAPDVEVAETEDARRTGPRIIAVGGGKGGVGKSLIAANIGVYLAQLGKRVVLIDADLGGANLHNFVGVERPTVTLGDFFDKRVAKVQDCVVPTAVANLGLISGEGDPIWAANPKPATKNRLLTQIRTIESDYLVCDLPSGSGFTALDFFLVAHLGLLVVAPEPTSVENTFRFMKSAFLRRLRTVRDLDKIASGKHDGGMPAPLDLYAAALRDLPTEAPRILEEIKRFRPRLIINQARAKADQELGASLRSTGRRRLGISIDSLGVLETDDAVWQAVRRRRPLLTEHPEAKISKDLERIARRVLAAVEEKPHGDEKPPRSTPDQTLYEMLELEPGASDEEIRRAHRRQREVYAGESMAVAGLYSPDGLAQVQDRIEEAYDTLLDSSRRHTYDLNLFPSGVPSRAVAPVPAQVPAQSTPAAGHSQLPPVPDLPEPAIGPDTEITGSLLRRLRESRGISLQDIAARTKVGATHLRNVEEERWDALPAEVYLRGFLVEFARYMRLDIAQVTSSYLQRFRRGRKPVDD
jgi:flagellar biosynthesis protein FlhG